MKLKWVKHQFHSSIGNPEFVTVNYHGDILFGVKAKKQIIKDAKFVEINHPAASRRGMNGACASSRV